VLKKKKECTTIVSAEHEGMWNVLLKFRAINGEAFQRPLNVSPDFTVDIVKACFVLRIFLLLREKWL
jgi:hypothetical protein